MNEVIQIISSLGFPIAACVFICWYVYKQNEDYRADIKELQAQHRDEIDKITKAFNKLCDKLDEFIISLGGRSE